VLEGSSIERDVVTPVLSRRFQVDRGTDPRTSTLRQAWQYGRPSTDDRSSGLSATENPFDPGDEPAMIENHLGPKRASDVHAQDVDGVPADRRCSGQEANNQRREAGSRADLRRPHP